VFDPVDLSGVFGRKMREHILSGLQGLMGEPGIGIERASGFE
jgi:hypothetical protein